MGPQNADLAANLFRCHVENHLATNRVRQRRLSDVTTLRRLSQLSQRACASVAMRGSLRHPGARSRRG